MAVVHVPPGCKAILIRDEIVEQLRGKWSKPVMLQMRVEPVDDQEVELVFKRIYDWEDLVRAFQEYEAEGEGKL